MEGATNGELSVLATLEGHATVRDYDDRPVSTDSLQRLIGAAQRAPTDATGQMYSLIRITDSPLRRQIARLSGDQDHVRAAPEFLVVCLDVRRLRLLLEHRGEKYGMQPRAALLFGITDSAMMAYGLALAAESLGLGYCFIGGIQNHGLEIAQLLELPVGVMPLWGLCLGWPQTKPDPKPRLPTSLVLHENHYRDPDPAQLDAAFRVMAAATRSGDWLNPLRKYFSTDGHMAQREAGLARLVDAQGLAPRP